MMKKVQGRFCKEKKMANLVSQCFSYLETGGILRLWQSKKKVKEMLDFSSINCQ